MPYVGSNIVANPVWPVTGHMNTNRGGYEAANTKRIETWEQLRERLFRLAELGDELTSVVTGPITTWLYREIETEAARVAEVSGAYVDECERRRPTPLGCGGLSAVAGRLIPSARGPGAGHCAPPGGWLRRHLTPPPTKTD